MFKRITRKNFFDESIKEQSLEEWKGVLEFLETGEDIIDFCPTEFTTLGGGERRSDNVFITPRNYYLNVENSFIPPIFSDFVKQIDYGIRIYDYERRINPRIRNGNLKAVINK